MSNPTDDFYKTVMQELVTPMGVDKSDSREVREIKKLDALMATLGLTEEHVATSPEVQAALINIMGMIDDGAKVPFVDDFQRVQRNRAKRARKKYR